MGSGMVGLHTKGSLTGESFAISSDQLVLVSLSRVSKAPYARTSKIEEIMLQ